MAVAQDGRVRTEPCAILATGRAQQAPTFVLPVRCGGLLHELGVEAGRVVALDHDIAAENVARVLGAADSECARVVAALESSLELADRLCALYGREALGPIPTRATLLSDMSSTDDGFNRMAHKLLALSVLADLPLPTRATLTFHAASEPAFDTEAFTPRQAGTDAVLPSLTLCLPEVRVKATVVEVPPRCRQKLIGWVRGSEGIVVLYVWPSTLCGVDWRANASQAGLSVSVDGVAIRAQWSKFGDAKVLEPTHDIS